MSQILSGPFHIFATICGILTKLGTNIFSSKQCAEPRSGQGETSVLSKNTSVVFLTLYFM